MRIADSCIAGPNPRNGVSFYTEQETGVKSQVRLALGSLTKQVGGLLSAHVEPEVNPGGAKEVTNRVHIDAPAGIIEVEGEVEFVEGVLDKVFPLLEQSKFGSHPTSIARDASGSSDNIENSDDKASDEGEKTKTRRRRGSTPPKGQSCADRILVLKGESFFKKHRTVAEIVDGLKVKGWTHNGNQVGAALTNMFGRGDIQRTKEGDSAWKYFWDRG